MELLILCVVMAVVVAMVAKSKGRSGAAWFFYGLMIWPIGLVHALLLRQEPGTSPGFGPNPSGPRPGRDHSPPPPPPAEWAAPPSVATRPLDVETLQVAAEWRSTGRTFTMIDAKEEARLRLLEHENRHGV